VIVGEIKKTCGICGESFESNSNLTHCPIDKSLLANDAGGDLTGVIIDHRYHVTRSLGEGGFSKVYEATHIQLRKPVAIKVLHAHLRAHEEAVARLQQEAAATAALQHPGIVAATDFGCLSTGQPYIVMELVKGNSIAHRLEANGALPVAVALPIFIGICEAVSAAHARGIIHRDLKPSNILLVDQDGGLQVKIVDFGLAKLLMPDENHGHSITEMGLTVGTPDYMSPEQWAGMVVDGRADIYSLGCVMFEAISGHKPFAGQNAFSIMSKHVAEPPPRLGTVCPERQTPEAMDTIIINCLAKDPADRYQTMEDVKADLVRLLEALKANQTVHLIRRDSHPRAKLLVPLLVSLGVCGSVVLSVILLRPAERSNQIGSRRVLAHNEMQSEKNPLTAQPNVAASATASATRSAQQPNVTKVKSNIASTTHKTDMVRDTVVAPITLVKKPSPPLNAKASKKPPSIIIEKSSPTLSAQRTVASVPTKSAVEMALPASDDAYVTHLNLDSAVLDKAVWWRLGQMKRLESLSLKRTAITDADLPQLLALPLSELSLDRTRITDSGLKVIGRMSGLERLHLGATKISNDGIYSLAGLKHLKKLCLRSTTIDDRAIPALAQLSNLHTLWISGANISEEGVALLKQQLPSCKIKSAARDQGED